MITRALILAAGRGVRIGNHEGPNCLEHLGGISLIERTLRVLAGAGIKQVAVTIGYQGDGLRRFLDDSHLAAHLGLALTFFENPAWEKPNGLSVQVARSAA